MKLLRVRLDAPWTAGRDTAWVLANDRGEILQEASTPASQWPSHDVLEVVIAASHVRIIAPQLPPLPPARVASAARFAVEDQIADAEAVHVGVSRQRGDGRVLATLCARKVIESLHGNDAALANLERVVAEPELAPATAEWRWCQDNDTGTAFVRLPDGSAFAVSAVTDAGALPAEIVMALAERGGSAPVVHVEWPVNAQDLARWQQQYGVRFAAAPRFDWRRAPTPESATNLLQGEFAAASEAPRPAMRRIWMPALWLLGAAAAIQVLGTLGEWISLRVQASRAQDEWLTLAVAADLPRDALSSKETLRAALSRRHDQLLHVHHRFARHDALPLMARASSAIDALPGGTVKRAIFSDGHWTIEIEGANAAALADVESRLRAASLETIVVPTAAGARVRIGTP